MQSIANLESDIRDRINKPRKQYLLLRDSPQWYKLCSSMDVIGDTELAITNYLDNIDKPASIGELYVLLYGILQVLFVQQDAVKDLSEALELEYEPNLILEMIREIRNDSSGHPTKRGGGKGRAFNFITRTSMSRTGFSLVTAFPDRKFEHKQVDLCKLIDDQRIVLRKVLENVISYLRKEEMEHKNQYENEKLEEIFHPAIYYFEKVTEAILGNTPKEFGKGLVEVLASVPQKFRMALETRGIFQAYNLEDDFEWVEYAISKIKQYFDDSSELKLNEKDAYIYLSFLKTQIKQLEQTAKEIDDDYVSVDN